MKRKIGVSSGYSLAEILVVIAIVGMLSLITIPAFINYSQQGRLKAAVRQFHGDMRTLRLQAITNNIRIRAELQPDKVTYNFYSSTDNGSTWSPFVPKGQTQAWKAVQAPVQFTATTFLDIDADGKPDIVYLPNGMLDTNCWSTSGLNSTSTLPTVTMKVPWKNIQQNIMTITFSPAGNISTVGTHS